MQRSEMFRAACRWSAGRDITQVTIMILGIGGNISAPGLTPPGGSRWGASGVIDGSSDVGDKIDRPARMRLMERAWIPRLTDPGGAGQWTFHHPPGSSGTRPFMGHERRSIPFGDEIGSGAARDLPEAVG